MNPERKIDEWYLLRISILFLGIGGGIYIFVNWLLLPLLEIAFVPILLSLFISVLLEPIVIFMERKGLERRFAVNVCFVTFHFLVIIFVYVTARELSFERISDFPSFIANLFNTLDAGVKKIVAPIEKNFPDADISTRISEWVNAFASWMIRKASSVFSYLFYTIFLTPFITYFLLRDRRAIMKKITDIIPNEYFEMSVYLIKRIVDQLEKYLRGKLIESFIITIVIILFLFPLHPPYLVTQALFAGIMNIIPYLGPLIGALPGIIIAVYSFSTTHVLYVAFVYFVIAQIIVDNIILVPFFLSHVSDLHPLTVIFAIAIGGEVGGIVGMIVSIPIFMALKIILSEIYYYFKFKGKLPV